MTDSKLFGIDIGYLIVAVVLTAAVVAVIWYAKSRGPKTAKDVHHREPIDRKRDARYPTQAAQPEDDGN